MSVNCTEFTPTEASGDRVIAALQTVRQSLDDSVFLCYCTPDMGYGTAYSQTVLEEYLMAAVAASQSSPISAFNLNNLQWMHFEGGPEFDYPINYWLAILGVKPETGNLDFLVKWEPGAYCHFHRHIGETTTLILEGEHHVVETTANQTLHKIRKPGHYSRTPDGEAHMEYAGPEGTLVFFSMQSADGRLFEILDKDENVLGVATIEGLVSGRFAS